MGGEHLTGPVADAQDLVALRSGQESNFGAYHDNQVGGLLNPCGKRLQVRDGNPAQQRERGLGRLGRPEHAPGGIPAVGCLLSEVAVDKHREEPVSGRDGDSQAVGGVGNPQRALLLKKLRQV